MRLIHGPGGPLPHIPDDLTVPQFMLDVQHSIRPKPEKSRPWMIEEATGREVGEEEVSVKLVWPLGDRSQHVEELLRPVFPVPTLTLCQRCSLTLSHCEQTMPETEARLLGGDGRTRQWYGLIGGCSDTPPSRTRCLDILTLHTQVL